MSSPEDKMRITFGSIKNNSKANKDVKIKPEPPKEKQIQYNVNKITVEIDKVDAKGKLLQP